MTMVGLLIGASPEVAGGTGQAASDPSGGAPDVALSGAMEVPSLRTATSRTWVRPDGAMVTRVYQVPVNFLGNGSWRPIDNALRVSGRSGYGWETTAGNARVLLPRRLGDAPVRLERNGRAIAFSLHGANVAASVDARGRAMSTSPRV